MNTELRALLEHGAACVRVARRDKMPLGRAWHALAATTADVIGGWVERGYNIGLLCGAARLIDVEYDDATGRETLARLGLLDVPTPTWSSERGQHRLFRLAEPLPTWGWRKVGGVEVRVGGRPTQSVLPPSVHPSGEPYRWIVSPSQCDPAMVTLDDFGISKEGSR